MKRINYINFIKKTALVLVASGLTISCTDNFASINTDPNSPTKVTPDLLLTPLLHSIVQGQFNYDSGAGLAHQIAHTNYNETEQYAFGTNEGTWSTYYLNLNNIEEMIKVSDRDNRPSCKAIAYVLKAFCISQLTDMWGDVPYIEAVQGSTKTTPKYDVQKDIYTADGGIISLLNQADNLLSTGNDVLPSDLIYKGDRTKWRKLANSLRLRYLMRISNKAADITTFNLKEEIRKAMSSPLMETNADNMLLPFLNSRPNMSPIYEMRSGEFEYNRMSDEMASVLNAFHDPRAAVWFAPTTNSASTSSPAYKGVAVGCSSTTLEKIKYSMADVSMIGNYYRTTPDACSAILMNCSEVKFLQAEAIVRGLAAGNAKNLYEQGINLSMNYYKVVMPSGYLSQEGVAYNENDAINEIMVQKWLSLFFVGYEAWFDYLRTGLPKQNTLLDNRNPTVSGGTPSRFYYPENEQALNSENYKQALEAHGGKDDINTKLWWE